MNEQPLVSVDEMAEVDKALCLGIPRELALTAAGISGDRMNEIQANARRGVEPYKTWISALEQTEARAKVKHLIKYAESPDWRARAQLLKLLDPSLLDGSTAEHQKTYDWMISVVSEETDEETFGRILGRFATEGPGTQVESPVAEGTEAKLH